MSTQSSPQEQENNYMSGGGSPFPMPAAGKFEDDGNNSDGESSIHSGIGLEAMDLTHTDALSATSAQENMNLSSESELVSDDLLKIEGKGFIGKIEKLPLSCKIILSCLFSIFALFFFGAVTIAFRASDTRLAIQGQSFAALTGDLANKIKAVQNERGAASLVLVNVGQAGYVNYYLSVVNRTNTVMANVTALKELDPLGAYQLQQIISNVTTAMQQLALYRSRIAYSNPTAITAYASYQFYSEFVQTLLSALYKLSSVFGYRLNPSNFVQLLELEEQYDLIRTIGSMIAGDTTLTTPRQQRFNYVRATRDYLEKIFLSSASKEVNEAFLKLKTKKEVPIVAKMEAEMSTATHANMTFSEVQWYINATAILTAFGPIKDMVRGGLNDYASKEYTLSVTTISIIVPAFVVATIISLASSFFFSRTIVGPWRRMNMLQSMTISKFVPKGFLNLMRWRSITDAQLGACSSRDLSIMIIKIKNYTETMSKLQDTSKTFQFMTDYLDYIAPLIKEHQGYIDKHYMDRFVLYFTKEQKALRSAITILKATETFNYIHGANASVAEKKGASPTATANNVVQKSRAALGYPPIQVSITLSYGKCLLGTVGEVQRMESSLVSPQFTVAQKLQTLAKKVGSSLLISKSIAERVGKHKLKQIPFRLLGNVKLGKQMGDVEVLEIVDDQDSVKMKTRSTFNKAVVLMHQGKYAEALQKFEMIAKASTSPTSLESSPVGGQAPPLPQNIAVEMKTLGLGADKVVKAFMTICSNQMMENQKRISQLLISQVLSDPFLHGCFEEFSKTEHSEENVHLWDDIQQFKTLREPQDRKTFARYIYDEYIDIKGGQTVNVNEHFKKEMREQMESIERRASVTAYDTIANNSSPTTANLVRVIESLELEIEVLMNDTLKRFRVWPKLKQEFHRSKHAAHLKHIKPECFVSM